MKTNVVEAEKLRPVLVEKVQQMDAEHLDRLHRIIVKLEMLEAANELHAMADAAGERADAAGNRERGAARGGRIADRASARPHGRGAAH